MKTQLKAFVAILMALCLCLPLWGCTLVSVNEEKDMAQIIAEVGDIKVTKQEFVDEYDATNAMYEQYGFSALDMFESLEAFQDNVFDFLVSSKVQEYKAAEKNYTLTAEETAGFSTYVLSDERTFGMSYEEVDTALQEMSDEQAAAELAEDPAIDVTARSLELYKELAETNFGQALNREEFKNWWQEEFYETFEAELRIDKMISEFNATVTITDDESLAKYNTLLEADRTEMEGDPSLYKSSQESYEQYDGMPVLFKPDGYIRVRYIFVAPEAELGTEYTDKITEMSELETELGQLTLQGKEENAARITEIETEYATLKTESEQMLVDYLAPSKTQAESAYTELQGGAEFEAMITKYNKDESFNTVEVFRQKGKLMSAFASTVDWPAAVKDAALKLTTPGSYTEVIQTEEGFHIVQYVGKEPTGDVPYSEVKDLVYETTLSEKQSTEYSALVDEWLADTTLVKRYPEKIRDVGTEAA